VFVCFIFVVTALLNNAFLTSKSKRNEHNLLY
jgi:hypothetical protein